MKDEILSVAFKETLDSLPPEIAELFKTQGQQCVINVYTEINNAVKLIEEKASVSLAISFMLSVSVQVQKTLRTHIRTVIYEILEPAEAMDVMVKIEEKLKENT